MPFPKLLELDREHGSPTAAWEGLLEWRSAAVLTGYLMLKWGRGGSTVLSCHSPASKLYANKAEVFLVSFQLRARVLSSLRNKGNSNKNLEMKSCKMIAQFRMNHQSVCIKIHISLMFCMIYSYEIPKDSCTHR